MKQYEYRVCQVQDASITFVNGEWQGQDTVEEAAAAEDPFVECPKVWEYLNRVGADGWSLAAGTSRNTGQSNLDLLYLQKEKFS